MGFVDHIAILRPIQTLDDASIRRSAHGSRLLSVALVLIAVVAGCSRISLIPGRSPLHEYRLEGKVIQIATDPNRALIEHQDIPGFMKAMTMTYRILDPKEFAKIKVGDTITGTVFQRKFEDPFWLGKIVVHAP